MRYYAEKSHDEAPAGQVLPGLAELHALCDAQAKAIAAVRAERAARKARLAVVQSARLGFVTWEGGRHANR